MSNPTVEASVHLVRAVHIPGRTAIFAEAVINEPLKEGETLVFEHNRNSLAEIGLTSHDSLVTVKSGNKVLTPSTIDKIFLSRLMKMLLVLCLVCLLIEMILMWCCVSMNVKV